MKSSTSFLTVLLTLFFFVADLSCTNAFGVQTQRAFATTKLNLRPDQGSELEACAGDLLKAALEQDAASKHGNHTEKATVVTASAPHHQAGGPIAWCRRMLQKSTANTKRP